MNRPDFFKLLLAATLALAAPASVLASVTPSQLYRIADLGSLGGVGSSDALAINDLGHVTGGSNLSAFYWTPQLGMVDLGVPSTYNSSAGVGINNSGQIAVKTTKGQNGINEGHAFRWANGAYQDLGTFGGTYSEPSGIDELGRVAGYAYGLPSQQAIHAFRTTTSGTLVDIDGANGLGGDYSLGNAINSSGHVVGEAYGADGKYHAFYWPGSGPMQDLGFFASTQGKAVDISDNGIILGIGGGSFLWQGGVSTLISTPEHPGIRGVAVNNAGQVVGQSVDAQNIGVPVTWHSADGAANLNDLLEPTTGAGWTLFYVNDVNNAGQIVGQGIHNGELRAFLMTPIPEPSAIALLATGTAAIIAQRRRRRRSSCARHQA
jgi:probable HAF family extracellular repeat protein